MKLVVKVNEVCRLIEAGNVVGCTHVTPHHGDEIFATVLLKKLFKGKFFVIRVARVPENLPEGVIVYDIGGGKYDHHQRGGNGCRANGVPYSSAGLIWRDFGYSIIPDSCANKKLVWEIIDRDLIQGIDAIDNGVMPSVDYVCKAMSVSGVISSFNPTWNSRKSDDDCFEEAVDIAEKIFENVLESAMSKAEAEMVVETAIEEAEEKIMKLPCFAPWQDFVFSSKNPKAAELLYVVFPSKRGGYNCQCVPVQLGSFASRKALPESWRGLSKDDLRRETGVETAIFCHQNGFIGGAETLEDAIKLAKLAAEA